MTNQALDQVRVRFAPSPTGNAHIGNIRTALFNWLFAKKNNGTFLLRIEDTDLERSRPEYVKNICDALEWFGITSDETPVIQSERLERHKDVILKLLECGHAYRCYCTPEEIQARMGVTQVAGDTVSVGYDGFCAEKIRQTDSNKSFVIRFKIPRNLTEVSFIDAIRGDITFKTDQLDDFIIARSDGSPVYNFVVVVDDADMHVTHVIRGEDHISNTPKQILLYEAAGFKTPVFAHLPLILGPSGARLSKRDAAVAVLDYKKMGILAPALFNYLVRLGWSHGDQELFTREELINFFSLDHIGKKSAIFDIEKLKWMNGVYMQKSSDQELFEIIVREPDLGARLSACFSQHAVVESDQLKYIALYKQRVHTLGELIDNICDLLVGPFEIEKENQLVLLKDYPETAFLALNSLTRVLEVGTQNLSDSSQDIKNVLKKICSELNISFADLAQPLRLVLTGQTASPGVCELISALGWNRVLIRLHKTQLFLK